MQDTIYDHYIAIDWSIKNMAIARMTKKSNKITAIDVPSDIEDLQAYLTNLRGTTIVAIEETTASQWLYAEVKEYMDRIFFSISFNDFDWLWIIATISIPRT